MKSIFITGCSSGIGYATAHLLKQQGWRVIASCRQAADVARLQSEGLECLQVDVRVSTDYQAAIAYIKEHVGTLDAFFANAGFGQNGAVDDIPLEAVKAQFATNVFGTWDGILHVLPVFREQGFGRILVNSSVLGFAAMALRAPYNSSKFALEGSCDTLRLELAATDIHVSLLQPGPIKTRFRHNTLAQFLAHVNQENSHANYQFLLEFEDAVFASISSETKNQIHGDQRRKLAVIAKDLADFEEVKSFSSKNISIKNEAEALGILYVMEGSTLGGNIIAKNLAKNPTFDGVSFHYFGK